MTPDFTINCVYDEKISFDRDEYVKSAQNSDLYSVEISGTEDILVEKNFAKNEINIFFKVQEYHDNGIVFDMEDKIRANLIILIGQLCLMKQAIILHGAGLMRNNQAFIFLARDEGGKTTRIKNNSLFSPINDDQILFSKEHNRILAHSTPFGRVKQMGIAVPVTGIFVLVKADSFSIRRGKNHHLIASFWQDNGEMLNALPKSMRIAAFSLLSEIALSAPAFELKADHGQLNWAEIDQAIASAKHDYR